MDKISNAVRILRAGGLVAFPTETVYGLGADATHSGAVRGIFAAKGRPATNPLIAHVFDVRAARRFAASWPQSADRLAHAFWPGPLTLVVKRSLSIAPEVSAGGDTVGLRSPDHPLALELLRRFDGALAAPSANRSNRISPTTAEHVREELGNAVDLILDGGPCRVGIESTVLDLSGDVPTILRPGSITREQIEGLIGQVQVFRGAVALSQMAMSPGQQAIHYAPRATAYRYTPDQAQAVAQWCRGKGPSRSALLTCNEGHGLAHPLAGIAFHSVVSAPATAAEYGARLYASLRELDIPEVDTIFVEMPPDEPQWRAVRDRLMRATRPFPDSSPD